MTILKSLFVGAALTASLIAMPALANDGSDAIAKTKACHDLDLASLTDYDRGIKICSESVGAMVDFATSVGDSLDSETLGLIGKAAGSSAVSWAIFELGKAGNSITEDVCTPASFASDLFDFMGASEGAAMKENSGLNMLLGKCSDNGF